ncbi:metallophosphoesterase [Agrococcus terreus]|uniref:LTD domain-containing protein n=1 Tax=Agrococcus terreus TaxID=574649 RepID=A0ABQ2KCX9_9MICO|nr:metallophosphoesterase [Agrococcus terreus]GGN79776.1 hypothetical protein GCM10010968_06990 [Agrococcus terreus]
MTPRTPSVRRTRTGAAAVALVALGASLLVPATAATAAPAATWPLVVTEIVPNPTGADHFEYVEVVNTTDAPLTLGDGGYELAYGYADDDDTSRDVPLSAPAGTVIPAGGAAVLWLSYTSSNGSVDSPSFSEDDFRAFWAERGGAEDYQLVRVTGQAGMANGGGRSIRVLGPDGAIVGWSFYPSGSTGEDEAAQFRTPEDAGERSMPLLAGNAAPSPGIVDPAQLEDRSPAPEPEPEPEPQPEPGEPIPGPAPDSTVGTLLLTELVVDSTNVGGSDGYEFIELYNTTTEPVPMADHRLRYLYPDSGSSALWALEPSDAVIAPGGALVIWVKNGGNADLDRDDFNAFWGTSIPEAGLVETAVGGMANGSARGMEVITATGVPVSTGFYNMGGARDVETDRGLAYGVDPEDFGQQRLLGSRAATPGAVEADQVPTELTVPAPDAAAPTVDDRTVDRIQPGEAFAIEATIADDTLVRRVTLQLRSDLDEGFTDVNLERGEGDAYAHAIEAVDLTGKAWYEYRFVASDGRNVAETEVVRVPVEGVDTSPVRLSVEDGDLLSGTASVSAAGESYPSGVELAIDGAAVSPTAPQLERAPVFAIDVTATDARFRNAIVLPGEGATVDERCRAGDVLTIFERGTYAATETITAEVPLDAIALGEGLELLVSAGTKAWPCEDANENNDDFSFSNPRLVLPDGRTLQPDGYAGGSIAMGDSNDGQYDTYPASFAIPDDAFVAVAHAWDTTVAADGEHVVSATDGSASAEAHVVVDNTAPEVTTTATADRVDGERLQGAIVLDAEATDATSEVAEVVATLDGVEVALPHETSTTELAAGEHRLVVTATDAAGNASEETRTFTTAVEDPAVELLSPADGATVAGDEVELSARATDPTGDDLDVVFREGHAFDAADAAVTASAGETRDALAPPADREGVELDAAQREALAAIGGGTVATASADALPYQAFDVAVPEGASDATLRVRWDGSANAGAKVLLHVWNAAGGAWERVDEHSTTAEGETFALAAEVAAADRVVDGTARFLVQHSEGWAGAPQSDRGTAVTPAHPDDTPRGDYDFTLGWESDTQYYNEEFYDHQLAIHQYFLEQREAIDLQYVFHTGDIVDERDQGYQWENADAAYRMLDEARLPYGVLAGNHDVGNFEEDYGTYGQYFGEARYAGSPWYAESYEDNRGHVDLFTAGGIDFVVVAMSWDPGDAEIAWMNEVLAQHPERVGIINLHEYLLTTGGLGPVPQRVQDEVVATNPNVSMVMSGHYHDAYTRFDSFDDDGDGVDDRTVTQMLFDYQGLPEGGLGYLRLLQFDNEGAEMRVRTYSPSLEDYDADDPSLPAEDQDFVVSYETLGIEPRDKELVGDGFRAEVLTGAAIDGADAAEDGAVIGEALDAASGEVVSVAWAPGEGTHGWYVTATDAFGGEVRSEVRTVTLEAGDGGPGGGDQGGDDQGGGDQGGGDQGGVGSDAQGEDGLPRTGAEPWGLGLAVLLLLAGLALVLSRRLRRS